MNRHKDFEIWYDEETQRYRFSVEYWGCYSAKTLEEIQKKVSRVRSDVKRRLKEIERQNKAYYARLAKREADLKRQLKQYRESQEEPPIRFSELSYAQQKKLMQLILNKVDELTIKERFNVNSGTIAQLRKKGEQDVRENIQTDETLSNTGRSRIIMPEYSADVIGSKYSGCL